MYGVTEVDGMLADLGMSSQQSDAADRWFSTRGNAEVEHDVGWSAVADEVGGGVLTCGVICVTGTCGITLAACCCERVAGAVRVGTDATNAAALLSCSSISRAATGIISIPVKSAL